MAFTFSASDDESYFGTDTTDTLSVNVAAGDLIVVALTSPGSAISTVTVSDGDGNSYTVGDEIDCGYTVVRMAYCLSATSTTAPLTITCEYSADSGWKISAVGVFTPDGGETVTLDASASKTSGYEASPWETDSDSSTTGDDEVCFAAFAANAGTLSNHEIPSGTAADGTIITSSNSCTVFYTILSSTVSNIEAEVDSSSSGRYSSQMLCFKSVAAAGRSTYNTRSHPLGVRAGMGFGMGG